MNVVGYLRVSTDEQGASGLGLEAQRDAIVVECKRRGWNLLRIEQDVQSGKSRRKRPGLDAAVAACRSREADGIVAARLDRLSRSVVDCGALLDQAERGGWNVVALDFGLDLSNPSGRLVANVLAAVAQWEREINAARTSAAYRVKRSQGDPSQVSLDARQRIVKLHRDGLSLRRIADKLDADGVPALGSRWHATTIVRVLRQERRAAAI